METNKIKDYFVNYIDKMIKAGVENYVKEEIEKLEKRLPKEAERIAAEIAIEVKLWKKVDEFGDNLKIQLISK